MRGSFDRDQYWDFLREQQARYDLDLDPRHYETFAERQLYLRDLISVPNAISIAGLALVLDGCRDLSKVENVHRLAIGRGVDPFDGAIARFLHQESDMGALVDASCDKLGMLAIGKAAWDQNALPKPYISYVLAKNTLHASLTVAASYRHPTESFRPPVAGKHAMFGDNLGGGLLLYAHAYEQERPEIGKHTTLRVAGGAVIAASVVPEISALRTYVKRVA